MLQLTMLAALVAVALFAQASSVAGLLFVSMVLQAGSVLNIMKVAAVSDVAGYGVTPFHVVALVAGLLLLIIAIRQRQIHLSRSIHLPLKLLFAYTVVAVLGSMFLPKWFEGLPVHLLARIFGAELIPQPLVFSISNVVQAVTLVGLLVVLVYLLQVTRTVEQRRRLWVGIIGAWVLVVMLGIYEQLVPFSGLPSMVPFWSNNPGYSQAPLAPMGYALVRIGLPFSEPSYASAYLSAMTLGFLAVTLRGQKWWWAAGAAIISVVGLVNTLGSTGLAATGVAFLFLLIWCFVRPVQGALRGKLRAGIVSGLLLLGLSIGAIVLKESPVRAHIEVMVKGLIVDKATEINGLREKANRRALEIVKETYGLGVGMGSNRASSFFASLMSNTGVLGFVLFMAMLTSLLWRYWQAVALTDAQIFVAASLSTATLAMGLGVSDLNMPMYWGFIMLGFVFCPDEAQMRGGAFARGGSRLQRIGQGKQEA